MINARMMYMRPGNMYKDFIIESKTQSISSTGRAVVTHSGDGGTTLRGCLADANQSDRDTYSTGEHHVTHTVTQSGRPIAKKGDRLILDSRIFYIVSVNNCGALGVATLYYCEERSDIK